MEFRNYTPFTPFTFESLDDHDEPFQVVILRGTFEILPQVPLKPVPEQQPLNVTDEFYGEPTRSSVRFESDLAPYKPRADIVINAMAHAPGNKPLPTWMVRVQIGQLEKTLVVTGAHNWHFGRRGWTLSPPEPCTQVPLRYEYAYGGQWDHDNHSGVCQENPIGMGYVNQNVLDKSRPIPAPQILSPHQSLLEMGHRYPPEGFGALHKSWLPRRQYGGTYDEAWLTERHPKLPRDFDYAYYNCAHPDLIYDGYLRGDELVTLTHLHPQYEILRFFLPHYQVGLLLRYTNGRLAIGEVVLDTLYLDLQTNHAYLVWRGQFKVEEPLRVLEVRMELPRREGFHV